MTLDSLVRNVALLTGLTIAAAGCGGGSPTGSTPPPDPNKEYTQTYKVTNATEGDSGLTITKAARAGATISIPLADLGISNIDSSRATLREFSGNVPGAFVKYDNDGVVDHSAPAENKTFALIVYSSKHGTRYNCLEQSEPSLIRSQRNISARRLDQNGQTGPFGVDDNVVNYAIASFNEALATPGMTWGRVSFNENAASADLEVGYGYGGCDPANSFGCHSYGAPRYALVNTINARTLPYQRATLGSESFEAYFGVNDVVCGLPGGQPNNTSITNLTTGEFTDIGLDAVAFMASRAR